MSKPRWIRDYTTLPASAFWKPGPGETYQARWLGPNNWHAPSVERFSAPDLATPLVDYGAFEARVYMTFQPWNHPHVCNHEGPWTLHSCHDCDIREGKIVVALIAWLTGQQSVLDLMKPKCEVPCAHPGASLYEQCATCRHTLWHMSDVRNVYARMKEMVRYQTDPWDDPDWVAVALRRGAKRASFSDALGLYGVPYGGV